MQVTETLSEGLKRAYTVVVPAADIESKRAATAGQSRQDAASAGFPARQGPADGGPPALRHRGERRSAGGIGQRGHPAGADRARPAPGAAAEDRCRQPRSARRAAKDLEFKVELELLPEITLPDFGAIELTRMKAEAPPETVDKALADIAQRNRDAGADPAGGAGRPRRGEGRGADGRLCRADRRRGVPRRHRQATSRSRSAARASSPASASSSRA